MVESAHHRPNKGPAPSFPRRAQHHSADPSTSRPHSRPAPCHHHSAAALALAPHTHTLSTTTLHARTPQQAATMRSSAPFRLRSSLPAAASARGGAAHRCCARALPGGGRPHGHAGAEHAALAAGERGGSEVIRARLGGGGGATRGQSARPIGGGARPAGKQHVGAGRLHVNIHKNHHSEMWVARRGVGPGNAKAPALVHLCSNSRGSPHAVLTWKRRCSAC